MNYCTKCQSIYSQPGTCNCYAPAKPVEVQPYTPGTTWIPFVPPPTSWPIPVQPYASPFWNIGTAPFYNIHGGTQTQTDAMGSQYTFTA